MRGRLPAVLLGVVCAGACGAPPATSTPAVVRAYRPVGTWQGRGNSLMGNVNSETGQPT